jgi:hypothetical protein
MDIALLVIGGGIAVILLATFATLAARRSPSQPRQSAAWDNAAPGYMYSATEFPSDTSSATDCGDAGGGSGAGCDGGGGDGGGGGGGGGGD